MCYVNDKTCLKGNSRNKITIGYRAANSARGSSCTFIFLWVYEIASSVINLHFGNNDRKRNPVCEIQYF